MQRTLVIRFGSLGDLCICGWFLAGLADARPDLEIVLVTKKSFAPLAERMRGVARVEPLDGQGRAAIDAVAVRLSERRPFDAVIDAHSVLRSLLLTRRLGRRPDAKLAKDTAARLRLLLEQRLRGRGSGPFRGAPASGPLTRRMIDRFDALAAAAPGGAVEAPGARLLADRGPAPLARLRPQDGIPRLGLAPGAQWETKRWPESRWADLLNGFRDRTSAPVRIFLGPRETWFDDGPLARAAEASPGIEIIRERSLPEVASALAGCSRVVTNDSGMLHLAEAAGTPVTALFGPTVRAFGYFPLLPTSRVLEAELPCRPCSRNGKRACHRGDLACLTAIDSGAVLADILPGFAPAP